MRIFRPLPHTGNEPEIQAWETDRTVDAPFTFGQSDVEMSQESVEEPQKAVGLSISSHVNQQEVA